MKAYHFKAYLLASAGTVLIAASASAETTSAVSGPTDQGQATSFSMDEIVVTAQRVKESLSKTPVAVSVIGGEAMAAAHRDHQARDFGLPGALNYESDWSSVPSQKPATVGKNTARQR